MPDSLPRHMGLGALLKTVAESTELRTVDVKAVLDKLLAITLERYGKNLRIHMPPELLRAMRRKASPSGPWRPPHRPPRRKYIVIDNKINPPPLFRPHGPHPPSSCCAATSPLEAAPPPQTVSAACSRLGLGVGAVSASWLFRPDRVWFRGCFGPIVFGLEAASARSCLASRLLRPQQRAQCCSISREC